MFARRPPPGWTEVKGPLLGILEKLGVPVVHAPDREPGPMMRRHPLPTFWCPKWAPRLYWSWPMTLNGTGGFGTGLEKDLLERAVAALVRDPDAEDRADAILAAFRLGGFDAVERMLQPWSDE